MLLHGLLLTPTGIIEDGQVLVIGNEIVCVGADCTGDADASNATWVATGGVISPGLIDAHNHLIYNFLPEWVPPGGTIFRNRYQWSEDPVFVRQRRDLVKTGQPGRAGCFDTVHTSHRGIRF